VVFVSLSLSDVVYFIADSLFCQQVFEKYFHIFILPRRAAFMSPAGPSNT